MVFKKGYKQSKEHKERIIQAIRLQHKTNLNYGMNGKKHTNPTKKKMSLASLGKSKSKSHIFNWQKAMNKLRKEGKLKAWNKGLTPRIMSYPRATYRSHRSWTSQKDNFYRVPKGMIIHHIDLNPYNNNSSNLVMLDNSTHHKLHNQMCLIMRNKL